MHGTTNPNIATYIDIRVPFSLYRIMVFGLHKIWFCRYSLILSILYIYSSHYTFLQILVHGHMSFLNKIYPSFLSYV